MVIFQKQKTNKWALVKKLFVVKLVLASEYPAFRGNTSEIGYASNTNFQLLKLIIKYNSVMQERQLKVKDVGYREGLPSLMALSASIH